MTGLLWLLAIITATVAAVVYTDRCCPRDFLDGLFGEEPDLMAPWADREPGDLNG